MSAATKMIVKLTTVNFPQFCVYVCPMYLHVYVLSLFIHMYMHKAHQEGMYII